jgi:hypothetical protein
MKKLISAEKIESMFESGELRLEVDMDNSIITPQARSKAQSLGVELVEIKKVNPNISFNDRKRIIEEVLKKFPGGKYSRSKIEQAVKEVVNSGKWME